MNFMIFYALESILSNFYFSEKNNLFYDFLLCLGPLGIAQAGY